MAKAKKKDAITVESEKQFRNFLQKLVDAYNQIAEAMAKRDAAKNKADEAYAQATVDDQQILDDLHGPAMDYAIAHKADLIPDGGQSAVIGPVTIEFRVGNPVVMDKHGKQPKDATIVNEVEAAIKRARGTNQKLLEGCLDYRPKLNKDALKNLPPELLDKLGLHVEQPEKVDWKPNAER